MARYNRPGAGWSRYTPPLRGAMRSPAHVIESTTADGDIGAAQNRISHAMENTDLSAENLAAAESVIRDVDMAAEGTNRTKYQILQQAGTSMLAQAKSAPQGVLSLLRR